MDQRTATLLSNAEAAVRSSPESAEAWGQLAMTYMAYDLPQQAQACFQEAEKLAPEEFRWVYLQAISLARTEPEPQVAIECFRRAIDIRDDFAIAKLRLSELLLHVGAYDEAQQQLDSAVRLEPDNPLALLLLGRLALLRSQPEESLNWLHKAAKAAPQDRFVRELLAQAFHKTGAVAEANEQSAIAESLPPIPTQWNDPYMLDVGALREDAKSVIESGRMLANSGRVQEAIDVLNDAVRRFPDEADAYVELWRALTMANLPEHAEGVLENGIRRLPQSATLHHLRGVVGYLTSDFEQAERSLQIAIQLNASAVDSYVFLGHLFRDQGRVDDAIEAFEGSIDLQPSLIDAHLALTELYLQADAPETASSHLDVVERLAPNDPQIELLRQRIGQRAN